MAIETGHILTALGLVGTGIWRVFIKVIKPAMKEAKAKKRKLYDMVTKIHHEINYNNGSSIKDAITRIESRIGRLEDNQRIVMNVQNVAFWESDADGLVTYVSPALCKLVGRSESEIMGNNWVSCIEPSDKEKVFDAWNFSVETKSPFDEYYRYKKPDGGNVHVWGLAFHKVENGKLIGSLGKLEKIS